MWQQSTDKSFLREYTSVDWGVIQWTWMRPQISAEKNHEKFPSALKGIECSPSVKSH